MGGSSGYVFEAAAILTSSLNSFSIFSADVFSVHVSLQLSPLFFVCLFYFTLPIPYLMTNYYWAHYISISLREIMGWFVAQYEITM